MCYFGKNGSKNEMFRGKWLKNGPNWCLTVAMPAKSWVNYQIVAGSIPHRSTLGVEIVAI